jgi:glycosyltransferase involved in cell wall biosynthesis
MGTWLRHVSRFIVLTQFAAAKFAQAGLPREKMVVKPNFSPDIAELPREQRRSGFLYAGRLSEEKGIAILADAVTRLTPQTEMRGVGSGDQADLLSGIRGVTLLGQLPSTRVAEEMAGAVALVLPSVWYEGFPMVLVEAFSCGLPVIASDIGALSELVEPGSTGLLFKAGDADDLLRKMEWAISHPSEMQRMGRCARAVYELKYTQRANYDALMNVYEAAIADRRSKQ